MEVSTATTATTATATEALNSRGGSAALSREASQTPGRDSIQPQPTESTSNGTHANVINMENEARTSLPATAFVQAPPPPPASQPASAQPPSQPASYPSPLPTRLPSEQTHKFRAQLFTSNSQPASPSTHQPSQHHPGFPFSATPPPSTPLPSQVGQPQQEPRDMNRIKTPKRFPSPHIDYDVQKPGFSRDVSLVADAVQQACPEAVRRVVRDKWEKCVMGSEFHHAFLVSPLHLHLRVPNCSPGFICLQQISRTH